MKYSSLKEVSLVTLVSGKKYETADVGESLARVMRYWTVRGKLEGVHPDLQKIGVQRIKFTRDGLLFVGDIEGPNYEQNQDQNEVANEDQNQDANNEDQNQDANVNAK